MIYFHQICHTDSFWGSKKPNWSSNRSDWHIYQNVNYGKSAPLRERSHLYVGHLENPIITSSNGNIFRVIDPWCGAQRPMTRSAWTDSWANNGAAGDLRRYRAHYDVIVMQVCISSTAGVFVVLQGGQPQNMQCNFANNACKLCDMAMRNNV